MGQKTAPASWSSFFPKKFLPSPVVITLFALWSLPPASHHLQSLEVKKWNLPIHLSFSKICHLMRLKVHLLFLFIGCRIPKISNKRDKLNENELDRKTGYNYRQTDTHPHPHHLHTLLKLIGQKGLISWNHIWYRIMGMLETNRVFWSYNENFKKVGEIRTELTNSGYTSQPLFRDLLWHARYHWNG